MMHALCCTVPREVLLTSVPRSVLCREPNTSSSITSSRQTLHVRPISNRVCEQRTPMPASAARRHNCCRSALAFPVAKLVNALSCPEPRPIHQPQCSSTVAQHPPPLRTITPLLAISCACPPVPPVEASPLSHRNSPTKVLHSSSVFPPHSAPELPALSIKPSSRREAPSTRTNLQSTDTRELMFSAK